MASISILGIQRAAQFWMEVVQPNYVSYSQHPTAKEAFNICSSLWHLIEWVKADTTINISTKSLTAIRQILEPQCPSLKIIGDITNLSKHVILTKPQMTDLTSGDAELLGATFHFGPSGLISEHPANYKLIFADGSIHYLHEEVIKCMKFWESFFKQQTTL